MKLDPKNAAILVSLGVMFSSRYFQAYFRRCKLRGNSPRPIVFSLYCVLSAVGAIGAVCWAVWGITGASKRGLYEIVLGLLWLVSTGSVMRDTFQKYKACFRASSPGELEDSRIEEAIVSLSPNTPLAVLSIVAAFAITFFATIVFAPLCLGTGWGMSYGFMGGWLGWLAGLALCFLRTTTSKSGPIWLKGLIFLSAVALVLLAYHEDRRGVLGLWLIGAVGGVAFATVYLNAQAGVFLERRAWPQTLRSLFRIPQRGVFHAMRDRAWQKSLQACAIAERKPEAEAGDPDAQFALCLLYSDPQGALLDPAEACKWCLLAAAQGHEEAKKLSERFSQIATPDRVAEGRRRAQAYALEVTDPSSQSGVSADSQETHGFHSRA